MSDTPYFDAYEARRRQRVSQTYGVRINTVNAAGTEGTVSTYGSAIDRWYTTTGVDTVTIYPRYRLHKTYTFIEDVRVVQDCFIESKANSQAEWIQVDESFNAYTFV
jgi:hypothetical protein